MQKGLFIVLDGNDGSGKATQAALLAGYLASKGIAAEKMDFPGYDRNFFGAFVGECLAGQHGDFVTMDPKIASVLYAADRFESSIQVRQLLNAGTIVIADRYASSNQIHQGGKIADLTERESFLRWLDQMEYGTFGIPRPDAVLYLRVPLETSLELLQQKRAVKSNVLGEGEKDTVESDMAYLENSIATAEWLLGNQKNWSAIDCMEEGVLRTREDIHADVVRAVEDLLIA